MCEWGVSATGQRGRPTRRTRSISCHRPARMDALPSWRAHQGGGIQPAPGCSRRTQQHARSRCRRQQARPPNQRRHEAWHTCRCQLHVISVSARPGQRVIDPNAPQHCGGTARGVANLLACSVGWVACTQHWSYPLPPPELAPRCVTAPSNARACALLHGRNSARHSLMLFGASSLVCFLGASSPTSRCYLGELPIPSALAQWQGLIKCSGRCLDKLGGDVRSFVCVRPAFTLAAASPARWRRARQRS
jgi:hypothetical protein